MANDNVDYEEIAAALRANVKVKDRWFHVKLYKKCFPASSAVDFLVNSNRAPSRKAAVEICRELQRTKNLFYHVKNEHLFEDEHLFFRFNAESTTNVSTTPTTMTTMLQTVVPGTLSMIDEDNKAPDPVGGSFANSARKLSVHPMTSTTGGFARKESMTAEQAGKYARARQAAAVNHLSLEEQQSMMDAEKQEADAINDPFETMIKPGDMRCLALVAHNHMKPAMKAFIEDHSEILKKFRLTGTNTTMTMSRTVFGADNPDVAYGPLCTSGPLGGDAQLAALMCLEDLGAIIFFMDPLSPHPHQSDIDSLVRLSNVHNVMFCPNPATAIATMWMLRNSLSTNRPEMIPSFFETLESPCVPEYKAAQKAALEKATLLGEPFDSRESQA
jgi:methylglyoxal synthase